LNKIICSGYINLISILNNLISIYKSLNAFIIKITNNLKLLLKVRFYKIIDLKKLTIS